MQRQAKTTQSRKVARTTQLRRVALFAALLRVLFAVVLCDCETQASCAVCDSVVVAHLPETPIEAPEVCICPAAGAECDVTQTGEIVTAVDWDALLSLPIVLPDVPTFALGIEIVPVPAYRPPPCFSVVFVSPSLRAPPVA